MVILELDVDLESEDFDWMIYNIWANCNLSSSIRYKLRYESFKNNEFWRIIYDLKI